MFFRVLFAVLLDIGDVLFALRLGVYNRDDHDQGSSDRKSVV